MIEIRAASDRGVTNLGWLDSRHTFSFGDYYDPDHMGYQTLRVINDDRVKGGGGFGTHPHRDMEIISCVLEGELEHKDSMGTGSVLRPDDVQRMSAGTGVLHSEFNPSKTEPTHFLQIWIIPEKRGLKPEYEQKRFSPEEKRGRLRLIASRDGRDGALRVHQDADLYTAILEKGEKVIYKPKPGRHVWLQVARGSVTLNQITLKEGDGASIDEEEVFSIAGTPGGEILLFDLA